MAIISVDVGTSMIKAVAYDRDGSELALARQHSTVLRPRPGWAEQDMNEVWAAVAETIRSAARQAGRQVEAITLTGQGDGCWLVDADLHPTGNAILWNDARASGIVNEWASAGLEPESFAINGTRTFAGLPHAIMAWLKVNDPARLDRSAMSLSCDGWVFSCLTGTAAMDESDAAAPFLDIRLRTYSPRLLDLLGIAWMEGFLPPLLSDDARVGHLSPEAAKTLDLAAGTPVVLAPYDIVATAVGAGTVSAGSACTILGTTLCTQSVTVGHDPGLSKAGATIPIGPPGQYLRAFPTLAGTEVLTWAADLLGVDSAAAVCEMAANAPAGAAGLMFMPYLSPAGERAPFLDHQARGMLLGLSFDHSPVHVARAVLEGLSFVIRDCLDASATSPTELRICGGGANSAAWAQIIADVTGVPTVRSADTEVGAKGAFIAAMVALGADPDLDTGAKRYCHERDVFSPGPSSPAYQEHFDGFLALRSTAGAVWPQLAQIRAVPHGNRTYAN
ncbi:FGGY family carbohydrate kinase [Pseudarthrobacter sp. 1C304]|uniref:FGGY family carbohydrate kinase n=1 Tax=Pseudarthrobacter sp. 1C304 TaxID=3457438 RepID=UPI003FCFDC55